MTNHERFPSTILTPYTKKYAFLETDGTCQEKEYTIYPIKFVGLKDIYYYLKNNPQINKKVFWVLQSRIINLNTDNKTMTYEETLDSLIDDKSISLPKEYIEFSNNLSQMRIINKNNKENYYTYSGGMPNMRRLLSGNPKYFCRRNKRESQKSIQLNINMAYGSTISSKQAEHLAYFILLIINGLQRNNYEVDVNTIYLTLTEQEIIDINIKLKKNGEKLNVQELYRIISNVDINRRIIFGVIETSDVTHEHWISNYGNPCDKDKIFKVKGLTKNDIYIGSPNEIGITGYDLDYDIMCASKALNLEKYLKVKEFLEKQKKLRR